MDNFLRLHFAAAIFVHVSRNPRVRDTCARYELGRGCKTTAEEYFSVVTSTLVNCSNHQYMWIPISRKQSISLTTEDLASYCAIILMNLGKITTDTSIVTLRASMYSQPTSWVFHYFPSRCSLVQNKGQTYAI
jgi:hypothetical protein